MIFDLLYKVEVKNKSIPSGYKEGLKEDNLPEDKIKRSLVKTMSWRIIGTLDTIVISYLITGTLAMALSIGSIELVSKMLLYFFHERAWNKIKWGK